MKTQIVDLPVFTSGYPLALSTSLFSKGYKSIIYTLKRDIVQKVGARMVYILISLHDIEGFKEHLCAKSIFKARAVVFASFQELKKHPSTMLPGFRYSKKDIDSFTPDFVNVAVLKGPKILETHQNIDFLDKFVLSVEHLENSML